jgi:hypothetical protein
MKLGLAEGPELDAAIDAVMENTVVLTGIQSGNLLFTGCSL